MNTIKTSAHNCLCINVYMYLFPKEQGEVFLFLL